MRNLRFLLIIFVFQTIGCTSESINSNKEIHSLVLNTPSSNENKYLDNVDTPSSPEKDWKFIDQDTTYNFFIDNNTNKWKTKVKNTFTQQEKQCLVIERDYKIEDFKNFSPQIIKRNLEIIDDPEMRVEDSDGHLIIIGEKAKLKGGMLAFIAGGVVGVVGGGVIGYFMGKGSSNSNDDYDDDTLAEHFNITKQQLQQSREEAKRYKRKLDQALKDNEEQIKELKSDFEGRINLMRRQYQSQISNLTNTQMNEMNRLSAKIARLESDRNDHLSIINDLRNELQTYKNNEHELKENIEFFKERGDKLINECNRLRESIGEMRIDMKQMSSKIENLENEITNMSGAIKTLVSENKEISKKLEDNEEITKNMSSKIDNLTSMLQQLLNQNGE